VISFEARAREKHAPEKMASPMMLEETSRTLKVRTFEEKWVREGGREGGRERWRSSVVYGTHFPPIAEIVERQALAAAVVDVQPRSPAARVTQTYAYTPIVPRKNKMSGQNNLPPKRACSA
jgi:hypothetical protein